MKDFRISVVKLVDSKDFFNVIFLAIDLADLIFDDEVDDDESDDDELVNSLDKTSRFDKMF